MFRRRSPDGRLGLAGVHRCARLLAHDGCGAEIICQRCRSGRSSGGRHGRQREAFLESETQEGSGENRLTAACATFCLLLLVRELRAPQSPSGQLTIAVIPKGTSHVFWQSIHAGAAKAAQELGVEIIWRGPLREDDRAAQVSEVEGFITRGVSGIVLAPLDDTALAAPVADGGAGARSRSSIIDSGLKGDDYVSFVATDNLPGRPAGGRRTGRAAADGGKVVMLRYAEGSASTERARGRLSRGDWRAQEHRGRELEPVRRRRRREARTRRAKRMLSRFKRPDGSAGRRRHLLPERIDNVRHAARARRQRLGRQGASSSASTPPNAGEGPARRAHRRRWSLQDPVKMGYLGVKTMVAHLKGGAVERRIDTGVQSGHARQHERSRRQGAAAPGSRDNG